MDKAVEKINEEMQKNPNDPYTEVIGHYIIDRCMDADAAEKVAADGKTLKGAMQAVMKKAEKVKQGNVAVLLPGAVFEAVDRYFGMRKDTAAQDKALRGACGATPEPPKQVASVLNLEDFL